MKLEGIEIGETDSLEDPDLIMEVMEARERLESAESREEVDEIQVENQGMVFSGTAETVIEENAQIEARSFFRSSRMASHGKTGTA